MPITAAEIAEVYEARGLTLDENGVYTGKRIWSLQLELASATDPEKAAIEKHVEALCPVTRWSGHPAMLACTARSMELTPDGSQERWRITVSYSSAPAQARGPDQASTPTTPALPTAETADKSTSAEQRLPAFSVSWRSAQEIVEQDIFGDPIKNTAGDPFDPPPQLERRSPVYNFTIYRLPWQLDWALRSQFIDRINSAAVNILGRVYPRGSLRVEDIGLDLVWDTYEVPAAGAVPAYKIQTLFFQIKYSIAENRKGWELKLLNCGRREKIPGPSLPGGGHGPDEMRVICDATGQPVSEPVPLTPLGRELKPGGADAINYLTIQGLPYMDFATLWI